MKKSLFAVFLTLCMVLCLCALTVSADETAAIATHPHDSGDNSHCVCGGSAVGVAEHQCADIEWEPLPEGTTNFADLPSGNYYLTKDVQITSYTASDGNKYIRSNINLCLNGYNITSTTQRVFGALRYGYTMNICDCSGVKDAQGNWSWDGTITGGKGSGSTSSKSYGGIMYTHAGSRLNIYGGNFVGQTGHYNGSCFVVANDGASASGISGASNTTPGIESIMTIYNGNIQGAKTLNTGGTIRTFHTAALVIHGGKISGGESTGSGGNIYMNGGSDFTMTGGTITGGTASTSGGNVFAGGGAGVFVITNGLITEGNATNYGANVYLSNVTTLSGGTISGGNTGKGGGNVYAAKAVTLEGVTITRGNSGSSNGGNLCGEGTITVKAGTTVSYGKAGTNADKSGGNIYGPTVIIEGGTISNGSANYGGGVAATTITMSGGTVENNSSSAAGGNLYIRDNGEGVLTFSGGTLYNGSSGNGGNIASFSGVSITVSGGKIHGGKATVRGGNIYTSATGVYITGGEVYDGFVSGNPSWDSTKGDYADKSIGVAGNVYIGGSASLDMTGGCVYNGVVNGNRGGNMYLAGGTQITGGKIWGGALNADGDQEGTAALKHEYNLLGGSIAYVAGSHTIAGNVSIGYDAQGNAAGGVVPAGGEGGNLFIGVAVTIKGNAIIANGRADSLNSAGNASGKGGNISGGGTLHIQENATIKDGHAARGGNITIFDNDKTFIEGGTITGGHAVYGGNIIVDGNDTNADTLTISGGVISNGVATGNGGNIYMPKTSKVINISGDVKIIDGNSKNAGGNIYMKGIVTLSGNVEVSGGTVTNSSSGNIYISGGTLTIKDNAKVLNGTCVKEGGNITNYGKVYIQDQAVVSGGTAGTYGGNIYSDAGNRLTITGGSVYNGTAPTGKNIYAAETTLSGTPTIDGIYVVNTSGQQLITVEELVISQPIVVEVAEAGAFATSTTDKLACFINNQGYTLEYKTEYLYAVSPAAVYVSDNGSDENPGTQAAPYKTLNNAIHMVQDQGTVYIEGVVSPTTWDRHGKTVTLTGGEMNLYGTERLEVGDSVTYTKMTITMPKTYYFYCNGFATKFCEDVTVRYYDGTSYTDKSTGSTLYGGSRSSYAKTHGQVTGTDLTVLSGVWGYIYGGNNTGTDIAGDVHLTVGGKVNQGVDYVSHTNSSKYLIIGGSNQSNITGTIYMNVLEGTTGTSINAGSAGKDGATYSVGNIVLRVTGGEGMAIYGGGRTSGSTLEVGTINFYYEGGTYEQIFGGSLSGKLTGDVNLYITGGKITRRVYGGCYSELDEETFKWSADNFVTGTVNLIIGSGANISCDLKDPDPGFEALLTGGYYMDRGIYGHSRRAAPGASDAENATIIFLDQTAYNNNKSKLTAIDSIMKGIMDGVSAADLICYLDWSADDEADVIYANATPVQDPETKVTGDASGIGASVAMTLSADSFFYTGAPIEPATVTVTGNWLYGTVIPVYSSNTEIGTATAAISANGYTVSKNFTIAETPKVAQVVVGETVTGYETLQAAVEAVPAGGYLKMIASTEESVTVEKDLYLDLNGNNITGTVTVAEGATLYGMDSTTDGYTCENAGTMKVAGEGTVKVHHKTNVTGAVRRYLTYTEADGTVSFHRIYLGITHMSLRPGVVGVGYKAVFCGDEKVVEMLHDTEAFGYKLWIEGAGEATCFKGKTEFVSRKVVSLRLQGFDVEAYGEENIYAEVYLKLSDGTVIDSADYYYTLRDMLEGISEKLEQYSQTQVSAVTAMCQKFATFMTEKGWAVDKILNYVAPVEE